MKSFFPILAALILSGNLFGQRLLKNQPRYDKQKLHFGFSVGMNYYDFQVNYIDNLHELTGYYNVQSVTEPGYTISIISNLRLSDNADLRFNPGFASTVRKLHFDILSPVTGERIQETRQMESSLLEFPLELKFKSDRIGNYLLYVTGAGKYSLDLASDEDIDDDRVFKLQSDDFGYELGFGVDIYFEYFKFSPQIKGIFGVSNLKVNDDTFLVQGIESIRTRAILINFTFE